MGGFDHRKYLLDKYPCEWHSTTYAISISWAKATERKKPIVLQNR
uniref:Uncharacterized protein n=1 Tax=Chroomonas placoidea TaxID=173977 RepID=A0A2P1G819_9CRYP|nr:hypothetical protein CplaMt_p022 [Chroomonas placoidea]AVM81101.1 hypothetical protein CplaMt_p022 [Chroomonas placoidea]